MAERKPATPSELTRMIILMSPDAKRLLKLVALKREEAAGAIVRDVIDEWLITATLPTGCSLPRRLAAMKKRAAASVEKTAAAPEEKTA